MDLPRLELKTEFLYRAHIDVEGFYGQKKEKQWHPQ